MRFLAFYGLFLRGGYDPTKILAGFRDGACYRFQCSNDNGALVWIRHQAVIRLLRRACECQDAREIPWAIA